MFLNHLKKVVLLLLLITISGCSLLPKPPEPIPVEIKTVPVRIAIPQPTMPRPIDLKETYWYVVSDKNLEEFLNTVKKQSGDKVVFAAMTIADYENMAYNMQEIKRYVEQSKAVILYYVESTKVEEPKVEE